MNQGCKIKEFLNHKIKSFLVAGDYFILKCFLIFLTAVSASVALDQDNKYLNLNDRIKIFFVGIPEYELEIIKSPLNNVISVKNKNNSPVYIHSISFTIKEFNKSFNVSGTVPDHDSLELKYAAMFSPYLVENHFDKSIDKDYYRSIDVFPAKNGIELMKYQVNALEPRSISNLYIELTPLDLSEKPELIYFLEGEFVIEYYVHDQLKKLVYQTDNNFVSYNGKYSLDHLIDENLIP